MAKYEFNIILTNGSQQNVTLDQLENAKLSEIDCFIMKVGYTEFLKLLANKLNISTQKINYVNIVNTRNRNIKISIVSKNEYLRPVLDDLSKKEIQRYGKMYRSLETVISKNNEKFKEMYNYLINQLKNNSDKFLINIYTYKNSFSSLLYQYSNLCKSSINTEEEQRNIENFERQICEELSIYKNYRGLCIARSKSEYKFYTLNKNSPIIESKKIKPIVSQPVIIEEPKMTQIDANNFNQFINDIGEEKEEFLEPEEMDYDNYKKYR